MTLRQTTSLLALAAGLVLALACGASAQGKKSDSVVKAKATATKPDDNGKQTVEVTLEIDSKYYLYANPVGYADFEDAQTTMTVTGKKKPQSVKVSYPAGESKEDKGAKISYKVYTGKVTIKAEVQRAKGDTEPLEVTVKLQACSNNLCLMPGKITLSVP